MKKISAMVILLSAVLAFAGCSKDDLLKGETPETTPQTQAQPETPKESETEIEIVETDPVVLEDGKQRSHLTGQMVDEEIAKRRPVAVMFNNVQDAVPQAGIANAEVVYEVPVEGGLTRLMGLLEDYTQLDKIGSVRSSRTYFVYFAREFDAIYAHFGQNDLALPLLGLEDTHNIDGMGVFSSEVFFRTEDRVAPHNAYTSGSGLEAAINELGYRAEYEADYEGHYLFAEDDQKILLQDSEPAVTVRPGYSVNNASFEYNENDGLYYRYQYGDMQIDETTRNQLAYKNIILQYTDWYYDDAGKGVLGFDTDGGGEGMFITEGEAIPITWRKDSEWGTTHYMDLYGNEIMLNQGRTWVCVIQDSQSENVSVLGSAE